jgi:anhydro-N-acetylmuramic acid kinase
LNDKLRTYTEHIALQIKNAVHASGFRSQAAVCSLLATGGGVLNDFLVQRISERLKEIHINITIPDKQLINFKEAMIMAFIGVLRWRQENNVLASVTGAQRDSINGALWIPI